VLGGASLALEEGEFVAIVGYSGSGKTTLISLIAGLLAPDAGEVVLDGQPVRGPGPERGIVFQQYSLLPWLTAHDNVALAVDAVDRARPAADRRRRTDELLALVGLAAAAGKRPRELSGGMRQRVAVARGLAMRPRILLMDEPFSALDALTRATLQDELVRIVEKTHATVLMVTHDVDEAVLLSDRIVMMTNGPAARIGGVIEVDLARPRERLKLASSRRCMELRTTVMDFLYRKQLKQAA
jgi:nitrate/nitrite transport system ATP-binding protein